ncbi:MAG: alpha/beta hydrolase family esterase [Acidimicrobiales bacterium]
MFVLVLLASSACSDGDDTAGDQANDGAGHEPPACEPARSTDPGPSPRSLTVDGLDRQYVVHLPPAYDGTTPAPLVFNLHGFGGDIDDQDTATGLPEAAGRRGYIVVTPQGAPLSVPDDATGVAGAAGFDGFAFWNFFGSSDPGTLTAPGGSTLPIPRLETDDVGFIDSLLDTMVDEYCVDPGRVFSTGMSNGAGMSTTLACELGDRFAAVAPVSGVNLSGACPGDDPVSVLAIHGDADTTAGYGGNNLLGFQLGNPSVPDRMAAWADHDGCDGGPAIDRSTAGLVVTRWSDCDGGTDVELWTLAGWGHEWPRATAPSQPGVVDATDAVLDFFDTHGRP